MFSTKYRIYRSKDNLWYIDSRWWWWPFWSFEKCAINENHAREIVTILKQKPLYF